MFLEEDAGVFLEERADVLRAFDDEGAMDELVAERFRPNGADIVLSGVVRNF